MQYKLNNLNTISNILSQLIIVIKSKNQNTIYKFDRFKEFLLEISILVINKFFDQILRKKTNLVIQITFDNAIFS